MTAIEIRGLSKSYGSVLAVSDMSLSVPSGQIVALLGPSGCGKTTTLKCIAGLEEPSAGEIAIDGRIVSRPDFTLPPEKRDLGMVFQSYALWPHMTVFKNVSYPLELRRVARSKIQRRVEECLQLVQLTGLESKYPSQLSGGQQQRVAVGRSIIAQPKVLLFDEPLSNLDAAVRGRLRVELKSLLKRLAITSIYVTHDQVEAMGICDRIVLMQHGRIIQDGSPSNLYNAPATSAVAALFGAGNLVTGTVERCRDGRARVAVDGFIVECAPTRAVDAGDRVSVVLRREALILTRSATARGNCWPVRIVQDLYLGSHKEYLVDCGGVELTMSSSDLSWSVGDSGFLTCDPLAVVCVPAADD